MRCPKSESAQPVQGPILLLNLLDLRLRVTLPGLPRWVTWLVGEVVVRLVLGLQSRVFRCRRLLRRIWWGGTVNGWLEVVVFGLPDLLTLLVLSGGAELGSGAAVAGRAVGSGCVDALRRTSTLP